MSVVQGFTSGFGAPSQHYENAICRYDDLHEQDVDNKPIKKMPVSYLQELCGRKKVVPIYELKASEGQVHEPTFVYVVTVEDLSGIGRGKNKKIAKHYAARDVLNRIVENERFVEWQLDGETKEEAFQHLEDALVDLDSLPGAQIETGRVSNAVLAEEVGENAVALLDGGVEAPGAQNAISKLYEIHMQRKWPPSIYEDVEESGPPHDKTFVVKVTLGNFEKFGTARTKRLAKRYAAEAMLQFLNEVPLADRDKDLVIEDDEENGEEENAENVTVPAGDLDADLSNLVAQQVTIDKADGQFTFDMNAFGGSQKAAVAAKEADAQAQTAANDSDDPFWERLSKIDSDTKPCEAHKELLQQIADHRGWTVSYCHLERKSKQGEYQCIVEFEGNGEKQSCFGHGRTKEEAEICGAFEALELLKILATPIK